MKLRNNRVLSLLIMLAMVVGLAFGPAVSVYAEENTNTTVEIVSFNDFHGNVTDLGKDIGMAKMIAYSKTLLANNPNTLFVTGGDLYQGTAISNLTHGKPVTEMMKAMGVTASAVGNHEFDWGVEHIAGWAKDGGFDFLATNIVDEKTNKPVEWAKPYKIIESGNIKIALLGFAHPDTSTLTKAETVEGIKFTDPVEEAKVWVKFLQDGKAEEGKPDVIIALTHLDSNQNKETKEITGNAAMLAAVEGIDGVISGHSHLTVAGKVNGVPVVQGNKNGRGLAILSIEIDKDNKVVGIEPRFDDLSSKTADIVPDPEGQKLFDEFKVAAEPILGVVLGEAAGVFEHDSRTNNVTLLGRWSSEVMKDKMGVQIAIQNGGGLRRTLEKGTITMGDLYEIMPFDNQLVTMELTGADVKKAIDHGINNPDIGNGQFAGLIVEYDETKEFENRITKISLEDGTPLNMEAYYTVVTNDFLVTGGDKYDFKRAKNVVDTFIPIRDVLVEAVKEAKIITPEAVDYITKAEVVVPVPVPTPEPVVEKYTVKSGDVLWRIAKMFNKNWKDLAQFNNLKNPNLIFPGQLINLPE